MVSFEEKIQLIEYEVDEMEKFEKKITYLDIKNQIEKNKLISIILYKEIPNKSDYYKYKFSCLDFFIIGKKIQTVYENAGFRISYQLIKTGEVYIINMLLFNKVNGTSQSQTETFDKKYGEYYPKKYIKDYLKILFEKLNIS